MRSTVPLVSACLAALPVPTLTAAEQDRSAGAPPPVAVFLDCNVFGCDFDHVRRQITWVSWVRDREDADVHLLITTQSTGGGGEHYTLDYLGRRGYEGVRKSLAYVSDPDDTDAEVREGLTRTIALGLVQFVETTPVAPRLEVVFHQAEAPLSLQGGPDPWNLWVFTTSVEGSVEGEAQQSNYSFEGALGASRVAESHKIQIELRGEYDYERFELDDTATITSSSEDYGLALLTVWSIGDHWSLGGLAEASRSTFVNTDLAVSGGPAVEYDLFPYRESTRRAVTFRYAVEVATFNYQLETVEGKTAEVRPRHSLVIAAAVQQPWGEIDGSVEGIQYLDDPAAHRINTFLSFEYRLFRGLSLDLFAEFSRIKDQFFLPAEGLTPEEILLRRRQRETGFQFDVGIGLSYRFGSSLANVVNPRFQIGVD
jgi:hypothetical protein